MDDLNHSRFFLNFSKKEKNTQEREIQKSLANSTNYRQYLLPLHFLDLILCWLEKFEIDVNRNEAEN